MVDPMKVVVCPALERTLPYPEYTFWSFIKLAQKGHPFFDSGYTRVDIACNKFAAHLLESDYTHIILFGMDHIIPSDIIEKLCKRVNDNPELDINVIACLNWRRGQPYDPLMIMRKDDGLYSVSDWDPESLVKVDYAGTNGMMISRKVFETIPGPPWFFFDYAHGDPLNGGVSEDFVFCDLCKRYGFGVYVDTAVQCEHLATGRINEDVYRAYELAHQEDSNARS